MTDENKGYNGWTNYETWNVALWIGNEQGFFAYDGHENGDLAGLAAAVGLDIDRETEAGEQNWHEMVSAVRAASTEAANTEAANS